jgi:arginase
MIDVSDTTVQVIDVPMDLGASRRGTDMGPSALQNAGLAKALRKLGYRVEETEIAVPGMETRVPEDPSARFKPEILAVCQALAADVRSALDRGELPLVLGGDHSIAMGTVSGVASHFHAKDESIGLLWFDAHGDMNTPDLSPSGNIHGMPLAHLLGKGDEDLRSIEGFSPKVRPENVALIGIRDIDRAEREVVNASGIHTFTMRDIDERGMAKVAREALEVVNDGTAGFHVSFDVDGCDPTVIPGSGTLVHGGVNFREAHLLLEYCADSRRMTSMELVELNPLLDTANVSAERSVQFILSAFGKSIL